MQKIATWIQKNSLVCGGICFLLAGVVVLCTLFAWPQTQGGQGNTEAPDKIYKLSDFSIVTNSDNMPVAQQLAADLKTKYSVELPVVEAGAFSGECGIHLGTATFNSYGGYKYSISCEKTASGAAVYVNGSGPALETAVGKLLDDCITDPEKFPFGIEKPIVGYEWNSPDIQMTNIGFELKSISSREMTSGVDIYELKYHSRAYGDAVAHVVVVKADAQAQLYVATADWKDNHTAGNPAPKHAVGEFKDMLAAEGYEVLAITNGGFYDLNNGKTNLPHGMQIVDGVVKKEPDASKPNHGANWLGLTNDGKYVIGDVDAYYDHYKGDLVQGVGGGLILMKDGVPCHTPRAVDYRTAVAVTKNGDLAIMTMDIANYAVINQVFMELDLDIDAVLNLDGGGSTTMYARDTEGKLTRLICETFNERKVADALAVVMRK